MTRAQLAGRGTLVAIAAAAVVVGPPGYAHAATPDPTPRPGTEFLLDPLGPTTDDEDEGSGNGAAVGLGIAAVALIGGGLVLRRQGRR